MKHILVINQHGENRGDEAAMRAMLRRFTEELGEVRFTILYQYRDPTLRPTASEPLTSYPIVLPLRAYLRAGVYMLGRLSGLDMRFLLPETMKQIVEAYCSADLVVSAPGGPYFGDLYKNHELVHWSYVWLGRSFRKPLLLYAPSAGPFRNIFLNPIRRRMYRKFNVLVAREEISRSHLQRLLGDSVEVHVTADSALQISWSPLAREHYFTGPRARLGGKTLVAVSLIDYGYPGASNPGALRSQYVSVVSSVLRTFAAERDCHFLLIPQLVGRVHDDSCFLDEFRRSLSPGLSVEIVDSTLDSDMQQKLFAMCDFHVASRYHPAIFGHAGGTPGICIYYEHKALGFMKQLGLERFAFDIRALELAELTAAVSDLLQQREEIVAVLKLRIPQLRDRARRTTELAVSLLRESETTGWRHA